MTFILCSQCEEVTFETKNVLTIPYVCDGCTAKSSVPETVDCPCGETTDHQHETDDTTSTFDATIALVADLEAQLSLANELSQARTELIEQLEHQNALLAERNEWQKQTLELVTSRLIKSQAETDAVSEVGRALAFYLGYAVEIAEAKEKENEALKLGLEAIEHVSQIRVLAVAQG
jgi:hypothetical protein